MASITGSATATLVSMLGAINTTANTLTRSINTTASALDMLDQYVQDARTEQLARSIANRDTMLQRVHEESAIDNARRQHELQRQVATDPALAKLFTENYNNFETSTKLKIEQAIANLDNRLTIGG